MKIVMLIQARMGSSRLPGKVLMPLAGKPMLEFEVERLKKVRNVDELVVATTNRSTDDTLAAHCQRLGVDVARGSEEDVLERFYEAAKEHKADAVARVTADCPLIDPDIVDQVLSYYRSNSQKFDYVSNVLTRTYPRGLDCECFSFSALAKAQGSATEASEREHVTAYLYGHPEMFRLGGITQPTDQSHHRWTVDTPEDYALIKNIVEALYPVNADFRMADVLGLLAKNPDWSRLNANVRQKGLKGAQP